MKHLNRIIYILIFCIFIVMICACKNNIDDFLGELNATVVEHTYSKPIPGDSDFDQGTMLQDKYLVSEDATLCLYAPIATSYNWQIYKIKKIVLSAEYNMYETEFEALTIPKFIPCTKRDFIIYIPDAGDILTPGTYKLELTVTDNMGKEYKDVSALVVYEPFYDINAESNDQNS